MTLTDLAGKDVLDVTGKIMKCHGDCFDPNKQKSVSTAVCCIHKAHKKPVPMLLVVKTTALCQRMSGPKDVIVTKVTALIFKVEIQHTTIT